MSNDITPSRLADLGSAVEASLPEYLRDLEALVNIDCGSYTPAGVNEVADWMAKALADLGAVMTRHRGDGLGDTLVADFDSGRPGPTLLIIGHMDTVFDPGTVAERAFHIDDGRAMGPGVSDMKAGLLAGLYAVRVLRSLGGFTGRLVYICNPDEEIGSPQSSPIIRAWAERADVALVLEGARANGDIVSSRKGTMDLELRIVGREAHAGVEPEKGRSAVLEAAHKVVAMHALNGRWPGVTVNAGVIRGGTRPNVVAGEALISVDVRAVARAHLEAAEAAVIEIAATSTVPDVQGSVRLVSRHWPMEKLARSRRLVEHAVRLAEELGFDLRDAATGGASDANTTAGMGVPTIDGLGPIGGLDHAPGEYVEIGSIVPRVTLLAALIDAVGRDREVAAWSADRLEGSQA